MCPRPAPAERGAPVDEASSSSPIVAGELATAVAHRLTIIRRRVCPATMGRSAHLPRRTHRSGLTDVRAHRTMPAMRHRPVSLLFVACLLALAAVHDRRGREQAPLQPQLARALSVPHTSASASTAGLAVDLATGRSCSTETRRPSLAPASNEKLAVTYAVLVGLGPEFRIETDVLGPGGRTGATWSGDLVLEGHGDPTLSSGRLARLARQLRAAGISRVTGAVIGDECFFDARPHRAGLEAVVLHRRVAAALGPVGRPWRVPGALARNPALAAARLFAALAAAGVVVAGRASHRRRPPRRPAARDRSPRRRSRASSRFMDRESDNFTAEMLLKQLGALDGRPRHARPRGRGGARDARPRRTSRSPACGSSTARASRRSTG